MSDSIRAVGPSRENISVGSLTFSVLRWPFSSAVVDSGVVDSAGAKSLGPIRTRALLVHGLASNALLWDPAAQELSARGWECVAVDLRGHGRSDKPNDGYEHVSVARDCSLVLDALGWKEAVVIGQSWGANIAIEVAACDSRVIGMVAVDGGTIALGSVFPTWEECEAKLAPPVFGNMKAIDLESRMHTWHSDWSDDAIAGAMGCFEVLADGTVRPWLTRKRHMSILHDLWSHRITDTFSRVPCPVLFTPADSGDVGWSADKRASIERALNVISQAEVVWFPGADHDLHAQKPAEFAEAVARWWRNIA